MEYVRLGNSGLQVSRLCLGCMSFGDPERGSHPWTLGEDDSRKIIRQALEAGINFFDTANVYSDGTSEEFLGRALLSFARREEVVIATKVRGQVRPGPNGEGLSRRHVLEQVDASLRRLGTDHIDLYQIHRWDPDTPLEETLETLNDVVRAGKVRYLGASSMFAWQFAKALYLQDRRGWTRFVSMQNHYNLLYREEEREMIPFCRSEGVGVLPWSPLARGYLAREATAATRRTETDEVTRQLYGATAIPDEQVVNAVGEVAVRHGKPRAQIALAWLLHKPGITAPIVGASKSAHLSDAVEALSVRLDPTDIEHLEKRYAPKAVAGHG